MKKLLSFSLLLFSLITAYTAVAQRENPLIISGDLLNQGTVLYDSGAYNRAVAVFEQIDRNDTNYVRALYGIGLCYYADSAFGKSIIYNQKALALNTDPEKMPDIYNQYANSVDAAGDPPKALKIFDSAIAKFPAYSLLYLNKGNTLFKLKRYAEAEEVFQQTIVIDPYSYGAHYLLGLCAARQGKLIPAMFCFIGYLVLTPEGRHHNTCVSLLNAIAHNTDETQQAVNDRKETPADNYLLLEQIVQSKIALDQNYKPVINLDDPISRQIQVVFEKMEYQVSDTDFYMQYYLPFYRSCYSGNRFEDFINRIFAGVNLPAITEYGKKHKKNMDGLVDSLTTYLNLIRNTRELNYKKRESANSVWSFSHGKLSGHGIYFEKQDKLQGPWEYYYSSGNIRIRGSYNDQGKKEGPWTYYYFNGQIKGKELYKDGKQTGEEIYYFSNGSISSHSWYKDNQPDGESTSYYLVGTPHTITQYKAGKEDGIKISFYGNGDTSLLENYSTGEKNGLVKSWFQNKRIDAIVHYTGGKLNGPYEKYYENGRLSYRGDYKLDKQEGNWKFYFPNGQLKDEANFVADKQEGPYKEYFDNGVLSTSYMQKHGKIEGDANYYDDDGKLYSVYHYEGDLLQKAQYFDKTGRLIFHSERNHKTIEVTDYLPDGTKKLHSTYNEKDHTDGTETFFYPSGKILETDEYQDGDRQGPTIGYFPDGTKKVENVYSKGKLDGYHKSFYSNGRVEEEGWYRDDDPCGFWLSYNDIGKLTDSIYYSDGVISGIKDTYLCNGKKEYESVYRAGWIQEWRQFDSTGRLLQEMHFTDGTGKIRLVFPNGKTYIEGQYLRGKLTGPYITYFPDGKKLAEEYYVRGIQDSLFRVYYHSGGISREGHYNYGDKSGVWKNYLPDGKIQTTEEYSDGKLNGKQTDYYENGGIQDEINFKDDLKTGPYSRFDPDGTLLCQVMFKENKPISYTSLDKNGAKLPETPILGQSAKIKTFFPNGNPAAEFEYKDGQLDGSCKLYFTNGRLRTEYNLKNGDLEGRYIINFENGQLKSDYYYIHDNLTGAYKEYNEKGVVTETGNYYDGVAHGFITRFDDQGQVKETAFYYCGISMSVK